MSIPEKLAAKILVRSARHCCICRRFLPLHIQIHHIIEESAGGLNEEDNLIPICIFCHSTVHTSPHMTRGFTQEELKGHRNEVFAMVAAGKLPAQAQITSGEIHVLAETLMQTLKADGKDTNLSELAMKVLLAAACEEAEMEMRCTENSCFLIVGSQNFILPLADEQNYPEALQELETKGFVKIQVNKAAITPLGMVHVEKLVGTTAKYTQKKVKCMKCSLHFTIHSWESNAHRARDLHCPECGQSDGSFLVWAQQKFGFIFEEVPGQAMMWDYNLPKMQKNPKDCEQ